MRITIIHETVELFSTPAVQRQGFDTNIIQGEKGDVLIGRQHKVGAAGGGVYRLFQRQKELAKPHVANIMPTVDQFKRDCIEKVGFPGPRGPISAKPRRLCWVARVAKRSASL